MHIIIYNKKYLHNNTAVYITLHSGLNNFEDGQVVSFEWSFGCGGTHSMYNIKDIRDIFNDINYDDLYFEPIIILSDTFITAGYGMFDDDENNKTHFTYKIILGGCKYSLHDIKTIKLFSPNISKEYINNLCYHGIVNILEWLHKSKLLTHYNDLALYWASHEGHINVLEWWKHSGLPLEYNQDPVNSASRKGHINVLEWWKNSGLPLKYDNSALNWASQKGHINVLEWWENSGLELKYDGLGLDLASREGHINVLEWWKNSGLELKYGKYIVHNLRWRCYQTEKSNKYYYEDETEHDEIVEEKERKARINVLRWWFNSDLPFLNSEQIKIYLKKNKSILL